MEDLFTKSKSISLPRKILAGHDVLNQLGNVCKDFELKSPALMVTGSTTSTLAGKSVADILKESNYDVHIAQIGEANAENVKKVISIATETKSRFILGVGGGSKIDIAKVAATETRVPYLSVPTSASH
ncbi:MAG: iron-containing alcohol dehydrogenase, partial [Thermoplasmata archaeon]|nr:iron-containing alcohol dehydrogenase [Thermoplasmata archaeon]